MEGFGLGRFVCEYTPVLCCCEHGDETSGFKKGGGICWPEDRLKVPKEGVSSVKGFEVLYA